MASLITTPHTPTTAGASDEHQPPRAADAPAVARFRAEAVMLLPFHNGLWKTTHFDDECRQLADRHYSRRTVGARQFLYAGRKLVLRDAAGDVLFGWMWPFDHLRMDGQTGYNCAIFRNESSRLASEIILEAEDAAVAHWGPNRCYTYVDPRKVSSTNPGYCFMKAGWRKSGRSKSGLLLFVKNEAGVAP